MYCVYFHDDEVKMIINATVLQLNENEVIFKDEQENIVTFFDRDRVKGVVKVGDHAKVI